VLTLSLYVLIIFTPFGMLQDDGEIEGAPSSAPAVETPAKALKPLRWEAMSTAMRKLHWLQNPQRSMSAMLQAALPSPHLVLPPLTPIPNRSTHNSQTPRCTTQSCVPSLGSQLPSAGETGETWSPYFGLTMTGYF
jgi:hypothetical protein